MHLSEIFKRLDYFCKTKSCTKIINYVSLNYFSWFLIIVLLLFVLGLSLTTRFDRDEIESIHTSWKILHGEKIYVDFFQHHHPLLYYFLVPLVGLLGEHTTTLVAARLVIFLLFILILAVTYHLAQRIFNCQIATSSLILLLSTLIFSYKGIEVRPDIPQILFGLFAFALLFEHIDKKQRNYLWLSAISLAISFLFLQKSVILIFVLIVLFLISLIQKKINPYELTIYWIIFLLCLIPYLIYLIFSSSLSSYYFFNWILNVKFIARFYAFSTLANSYQNNTLNWSFYILGLLFTLKRFSEKLLGIASLVLLFLIIAGRKHHYHYFVILFPFVSVIAANALHTLFKNKKVISSILILLIISPIYQYSKSFSETTRNQQVQKINYVLSITDSNDYVYDGRNSFNLFRKDIDFFWYSLNPGYGLSTYQSIHNYNYNIYEKISQYQPKVISTYLLKDLQTDVITSHYRQSQDYDDLLIRVPDNTQR